MSFGWDSGVIGGVIELKTFAKYVSTILQGEQ